MGIPNRDPILGEIIGNGVVTSVTASTITIHTGVISLASGISCSGTSGMMVLPKATPRTSDKNCRNCGANSFRNNKCEYCNTVA